MIGQESLLILRKETNKISAIGEAIRADTARFSKALEAVAQWITNSTYAKSQREKLRRNRYAELCASAEAVIKKLKSIYQKVVIHSTEHRLTVEQLPPNLSRHLSSNAPPKGQRTYLGAALVST
jgi:hypothetical protein